jgi:hypothetical protein
MGDFGRDTPRPPFIVMISTDRSRGLDPHVTQTSLAHPADSIGGSKAESPALMTSMFRLSNKPSSIDSSGVFGCR